MFLHVPKCAGTSIRVAFGAYVDDLQDFEDVDRADREATGRVRDPAYANHLPFWGVENLIDTVGILALTPARVAGMRKIMVVRNPWARMVSLYNHRLAKLNLVAPDGRPRNTPEDIHVAELGFKPWLLTTPSDGDKVLTRVPQAAWGTSSDGTFVADTVLRMERFPFDWNELCATLGFGDVKLPHMLTGNGQSLNYRDHYDEETLAHVALYFEEDIERFGYRF